MINSRQGQLDSLYAEIFGGSGKKVPSHQSIADLVLKPDANPPQDKFNQLCEDEEFLGLWELRSGLPSLSEYDMALARVAADNGWNQQEMADLLIAFRRKNGETQKDREKALRLDYIQRTLAKVVDDNNEKKRLTTATQIIEMTKKVEFFHSPDKGTYAIISKDEHSEVWALESRTFKDYLAQYFYEQMGSAPSSQSIQTALNVLRGHALFTGCEERVYVRLAELNRNIYLDLCDSEWRVIEISPHGWRILDKSPIRFVRSRGMIPLPVPEKDGDIGELKNSINVTEDDWSLALAWLLGAFMPKGPFPILVITGEQGSAKSTVAKMLRLLVDPSNIPLRSLPKEERDLAISAANAWILAFDNVSYLAPWISDAICRLSTGGGFATRELYANADEVLFTATRPLF